MFYKLIVKFFLCSHTIHVALNISQLQYHFIDLTWWHYCFCLTFDCECQREHENTHQLVSVWELMPDILCLGVGFFGLKMNCVYVCQWEEGLDVIHWVNISCSGPRTPRYNMFTTGFRPSFVNQCILRNEAKETEMRRGS